MFPCSTTLQKQTLQNGMYDFGNSKCSLVWKQRKGSSGILQLFLQVKAYHRLFTDPFEDPIHAQILQLSLFDHQLC